MQTSKIRLLKWSFQYKKKLIKETVFVPETMIAKATQKATGTDQREAPLGRIEGVVIARQAGKWSLNDHISVDSTAILLSSFAYLKVTLYGRFDFPPLIFFVFHHI